MRNHTRPVNVKVRIGNRPVELPWPSSALSGVSAQEINAWLDRENLTPQELGALANILGRLSCPSDLTPLGDPQLGRVSKAAKKRLPAVVVRQLRQLQARQKKVIAERKAKRQAIAAANATTAAPSPVSSLPSSPTPPVPAVPAAPFSPEPVTAAAHEPVVEPLVAPDEKALPTALIPPVTVPVPAAASSSAPMAVPGPQAPVSIPELYPVPVVPPAPQVVVQVPAAAPVPQSFPAVQPLPGIQPLPVSSSSAVPALPVSPAYTPPVVPNMPVQPNYRPYTPLPTEYSYGFDTPEESEEWDESYEEFGATEPIKSAVPELLAGIGLLGALAWFAMRKA